MADDGSLTGKPKMLDVVALLRDAPSFDLRRGQVGTVVEVLDPAHVLVEFSEESGRAFAIQAFDVSQLLILRYAPETV